MKGKRWIFVMGSILFFEGISLFSLAGIQSDSLNAEKIAHADEPTITSEPAYKDKEQKVFQIYKKNRNTLILVNASNPLNESYLADLRAICKGRLYASRELYDPLVEMLKAANKKGHQYWIASAYRSRDKQQKLVDEDVQKAMQKGLSYEDALRETYQETMPAGHSEHETGLALDILCSGNNNMDASQEKEAGNIWLQNNCYRYGFVLRYPKGKEAITGIHYEPWHFRYVGKEAAAYMKKHDLTLEEFWEKIIS